MNCFVHCYTSEVYRDFFRNILVLPVGTASSVERSFSYMKLIKTRICNSITDQNLGLLMRISIEGLELDWVVHLIIFFEVGMKYSL